MIFVYLSYKALSKKDAATPHNKIKQLYLGYKLFILDDGARCQPVV